LCIRSKSISLIRWPALLLSLSLVACEGDGDSQSGAVAGEGVVDRLSSLQQLSIESLRQRSYHSQPRVIANLANYPQAAAYQQQFMSGATDYHSLVLAYGSDGLQVYSRMDIPAAPPPAEGYPVLVFVHGWYGREAAPGFDFMYKPDSQYSELIDSYVDAGYVVLSPALRGHGTVDGVSAEGIEYLDAWDNASYLSPLFYAIDVLNLVAGTPQLEGLVVSDGEAATGLKLNLQRIHLQGHSQGADAVLTALAVSGEGSAFSPAIASGSIWAGCFGPRLAQARLYGPMADSLQAFMSGDGTWTGSALGRDGSINHDFIFPHPQDWIGTVDTGSAKWTWQADTFSVPTVAESWQSKFNEMYTVLGSQVVDLEGVQFEIHRDPAGPSLIKHDPRLLAAMAGTDAYDQPQFLTEPLQFHYSDQDYYSPPEWNEDLARRINQTGGKARAFAYTRNTHSLKVSPHEWFSPGEVVAGFSVMLRRDQQLFANPDSSIAAGSDDQLSIAALREYAGALKNEFEVVKELEPVDGMPRRELVFSADGLRQFALVIEPAGEPPQSGWPVLMFNHGYHPDPPNYGRIADGSTNRPGDYYREVARRFASAGFVVVVPDYRGHNDSAGSEFVQSPLAAYWYTRDVIAAYRALPSLPRIDLEQTFLWGHSMGGPITLRALLALGDEVSAASIWSSGPAFATSNRYRELAETESALMNLPVPLRPEDVDAGPFLAQLQVPLVIQHAVDDRSTPSSASIAIDAALTEAGLPHELHLYEGADHLLTGKDLELALDRNVQFFRQRMQVETPQL